MTHERTSSWFLRVPDGDVIDLRRSQFETEANYRSTREKTRGFSKTAIVDESHPTKQHNQIDIINTCVS
jgi:hypothetical protein